MQKLKACSLAPHDWTKGMIKVMKWKLGLVDLSSRIQWLQFKVSLEMNWRQVWSRHGEIETIIKVIVFGDGDSHIPTLVMGTCVES
jgi:hypothetical protein